MQVANLLNARIGMLDVGTKVGKKGCEILAKHSICKTCILLFEQTLLGRPNKLVGRLPHVARATAMW